MFSEKSDMFLIVKEVLFSFVVQLFSMHYEKPHIVPMPFHSGTFDTLIKIIFNMWYFPEPLKMSQLKLKLFFLSFFLPHFQFKSSKAFKV